MVYDDRGQKQVEGVLLVRTITSTPVPTIAGLISALNLLNSRESTESDQE